ncbi:MAG: T9SS type A sorting domain-containing protein, partial [Ignavibacteriaceae bacterium]|nr:T9SS type A sorting domain-containing protein [Ignavibacteriaceae bacterium]
PSLASYGGSTSTSVLLSYDARYYHKIYSKLYTPSTDSWSSEAIVYDGTSQSSYDRYSCISVDYYVYAAWNSYNSSTGYYSVKFRLGNVSNVWSNWQWTYSSTTANLYNPSITGYNSGANVAISEFTSPGNQILLHKANVSTQTWTTYTVGSNAQYPNLPNINYDSGTATPVEVWTGTIVNNAYPLSISSQDFSKLSVASAENSNLTIYKRAVTSDNLRIELGNISALTSDGQKTNIPLKSFDYTKQADLSKPWQYFETDNSSSISNVSSVSFDLSINSSSVDSLKQISKTSSYTLSPAELEIYNGEQLVYSRAITSKDTIVNQTIEFNLPNGVISCLRPVIKFSGKDTAISFTTIENTISETSAQANKYASTTSLPSDYTLNQNYPNPFNPSTIISYDLPKSGHVILKVYDILGREVSTLFNGNQNAGSYSFSFNASKLASGVYFYQIRVDGGTNNFISTKKMQILK